LSGTEEAGVGPRRIGKSHEARAELHGSAAVAGTPGKEQTHGRCAMNARGQWIRNPAKICISGVCLALFVTGIGLLGAGPPEAQNAPLVVELRLDREVEPVLAAYIDEGLADAARRQAALVLITMDTPGGLSDSMTDMIHHIVDSPVPVAVFVSPSGARGASAGFFILLSADVSAMAPGTRTGASTPILLPRGFCMRVDEALRGHLIDLIARDNADLLKQLNGREIKRFDGKSAKLSLENYRLDEFQLSARQKFLARIVDPDIFFLLLLVGVLGLYTEFTHPGVVAPGVIGGICA